MEMWLAAIQDLKPEIEQAKRDVVKLLMPELVEIIKSSEGQSRVEQEMDFVVWEYLADPEDDMFIPHVIVERDPEGWPR